MACIGFDDARRDEGKSYGIFPKWKSENKYASDETIHIRYNRR
jgi:hypothetical protein